MRKEIIRSGEIRRGTLTRSRRCGTLPATESKPAKELYEKLTIDYAGKFEVELDLDYMDRLIDRAVRNSGRKCKMGPVTVRVRLVEKIVSIETPPEANLQDVKPQPELGDRKLIL